MLFLRFFFVRILPQGRRNHRRRMLCIPVRLPRDFVFVVFRGEPWQAMVLYGAKLRNWKEMGRLQRFGLIKLGCKQSHVVELRAALYSGSRVAGTNENVGLFGDQWRSRVRRWGLFLISLSSRFRRHNFDLRLSHATCSSHDLRAIVAGFWNMFQNPTAFFELYATVLGKLWGWFTRSKPCRIDDVSKLHATVVSQTCAV